MIGYAIQDTLLVKYARKIDGLSLAIYRNLSFVITLLPLLLFTPLESISEIMPFLPRMCIAGICGACSVWFSFLTYRFLPVGIYSGLTKSITVIGLTLCGYIFLKETLTPQTIALMSFILLGIFYLGKQKNQMVHLEPKIYLGILLGTIASFFAVATIFLMVKTSHEVNPFVSGYFWESLIGVFALLLGLIRYFFSRHKIQLIDFKTFLKIALCASPTLLGTGAYAFASTLGPIGIVSTISATHIIFTSIFAHYLYQEKFNRKQWLGVVLVTIGIIALKLST